MDIWGVGCVFFEILSLYPLFPGNNELDQINRIHNIIGTPPPELLAQFKRYNAIHLYSNFTGSILLISTWIFHQKKEVEYEVYSITSALNALI